MLITYGCKDPEEYGPEEPPLLPPPDPPQLILPYPDTALYTFSSPHSVLFDWTTVSGAEIYEIQIDRTMSWSTAMIIRANHPPIYIALYCYAVVSPYYVRIRAGSAQWTYYTDWSEPRRFWLRMDWPILIVGETAGKLPTSCNPEEYLYT